MPKTAFSHQPRVLQYATKRTNRLPGVESQTVAVAVSWLLQVVYQESDSEAEVEAVDAAGGYDDDEDDEGGFYTDEDGDDDEDDELGDGDSEGDDDDE